MSLWKVTFLPENSKDDEVDADENVFKFVEDDELKESDELDEVDEDKSICGCSSWFNNSVNRIFVYFGIFRLSFCSSWVFWRSSRTPGEKKMTFWTYLISNLSSLKIKKIDRNMEFVHGFAQKRRMMFGRVFPYVKLLWRRKIQVCQWDVSNLDLRTI